MNLDLNENVNDDLAIVVKALSSFIPVVGGVVGELIGKVIPDQRIDRITKYLVLLSDRLVAVENQLNPYFLDLF